MQFSYDSRLQPYGSVSFRLYEESTNRASSVANELNILPDGIGRIYAQCEGYSISVNIKLLCGNLSIPDIESAITEMTETARGNIGMDSEMSRLRERVTELEEFIKYNKCMRGN